MIPSTSRTPAHQHTSHLAQQQRIYRYMHWPISCQRSLAVVVVCCMLYDLLASQQSLSTTGIPNNTICHGRPNYASSATGHETEDLKHCTARYAGSGSGSCSQYVNIPLDGATGVSPVCQVLPAACTVYIYSTSSSTSTRPGNYTQSSETAI